LNSSDSAATAVAVDRLWRVDDIGIERFRHQSVDRSWPTANCGSRSVEEDDEDDILDAGDVDARRRTSALAAAEAAQTNTDRRR
jgi:hypothetical protein